MSAQNKRSLGPKLTFEDRALEYLTSEGKMQLNPDDQERFVMVNFCDDQLRRLIPSTDVVKMLMKKFDIRETKAWTILAQTQVVFGISRKAQKEYFINMISENIVEDMHRARAKGDMKSMVGLYDKLIKVLRLDKDDAATAPDAPPPLQVVFKFDPSMFNVKQEDNLEDRALQFIANGAEDVPFTDVTDESGDDGGE